MTVYTQTKKYPNDRDFSISHKRFAGAKIKFIVFLRRTVIQNEYCTPGLRVFRFDHLRHLPKEKMTQMVNH